MAWRQQDYFLRLLEQIGAAIRRAMGLRDSGDHAAALEELRAAAVELLGPTGEFADKVDAQTALNIVGDPRRLALWARLLAAESELLRDAGDPEGGEHMRSRAREIARGAAARDDGAREQLTELLQELEDS